MKKLSNILSVETLEMVKQAENLLSRQSPAWPHPTPAIEAYAAAFGVAQHDDENSVAFCVSAMTRSCHSLLKHLSQIHTFGTKVRVNFEKRYQRDTPRPTFSLGRGKAVLYSANEFLQVNHLAHSHENVVLLSAVLSACYNVFAEVSIIEKTFNTSRWTQVIGFKSVAYTPSIDQSFQEVQMEITSHLKTLHDRGLKVSLVFPVENSRPDFSYLMPNVEKETVELLELLCIQMRNMEQEVEGSQGIITEMRAGGFTTTFPC